MCRLLGFRSAEQESLRRPLLKDERSLYALSNEHRDGWGLAYFHHGVPHVVKSIERAAYDHSFVKLAANLSSSNVIAHLRRATQGELSLLNCHPFQFGKWIFAHNGDMPNFCTKRPRFCASISPRLQPHIFGSTDSEVFFMLFLNELLAVRALDQEDVSLKDCALALRRAITCVIREYAEVELKKPFALNVLATNGRNFLAYRHGHRLVFNVTKEPYARLVVCSEPFNPKLDFTVMQDGQMIGMDKNLRFYSDI